MSTLETVCQCDLGHLWVPKGISLTWLGIAYDDVEDNDPYWVAYRIYHSDIYPNWLALMSDIGIAFVWEYVLTEDYSYFAYNFPTIDKPDQLVQYKKDGKRKSTPQLTKKKAKELEEISAAHWLLYTIGVKSNGTN